MALIFSIWWWSDYTSQWYSNQFIANWYLCLFIWLMGQFWPPKPTPPPVNKDTTTSTITAITIDALSVFLPRHHDKSLCYPCNGYRGAVQSRSFTGPSFVVDEVIGSCRPGFESLRTEGGALNTYLYFLLCYQLIALLLYAVTIISGCFLDTVSDPDHHFGLRHHRAPSADLSFWWSQQGRKS